MAFCSRLIRTLVDLLGVGAQLQTLGLDLAAEVDVSLSQRGAQELLHPVEKLGQGKDLKVGSGQAGELPVVLDEVEEALAAPLDGVHRVAHVAHGLEIESAVFGLTVQHGVSRGCQGGDGGDGVHDLVGEDADEVLPGLHLLLFELALDVLQRDQGVLLSVQAEGGGGHGQLQRLAPAFDFEQGLLLRLELQQGPHLVGAEHLQGAHVLHLAHFPEDAGPRC